MSEQSTTSVAIRLQFWEDDFRNICQRLAGTMVDAERKTTIASFIDRCDATIREIDHGLSPSSRTDLRLTKASAELELARSEAEPQRGRLIQSAAATCAEATKISLASGVTFEPVETISRALALLAIAVNIALKEHQAQLHSQACQHVESLTSVLAQMDEEQNSAMSAIMTAALMLDSLDEVKSIDGRRRIIEGSEGFVRQAIRLSASTANHDLRKQAQRLLTDLDAARRRLLSPPETNSGVSSCPNCGSVVQPNANFCAECGVRLRN